MSVSRSGYYKWKYRKLNPSIKELSRQVDIRLIKEVHDVHSSQGTIHSYYDGLYQVLNYIKKEQTEQLINFHTDPSSVYSSESYNKLLDNYNIERSMS